MLHLFQPHQADQIFDPHLMGLSKHTLISVTNEQPDEHQFRTEVCAVNTETPVMFSDKSQKVCAVRQTAENYTECPSEGACAQRGPMWEPTLTGFAESLLPMNPLADVTPHRCLPACHARSTHQQLATLPAARKLLECPPVSKQTPFLHGGYNATALQSGDRRGSGEYTCSQSARMGV